MTIKEIFKLGFISLRTYNVCNNYELKDLNAILNYYKEYKTFEHFKNCGRKSNEELIKLCSKYVEDSYSPHPEIMKIENPISFSLSNLTRTKRELINSFIDINYNNLSNRSKNAITSLLNGNLKIRNIGERILINEHFDVKDIKNVGKKSVTEISSFIDSIKSLILKVSNIENENDLIALRNRFFIEKKFSITDIPNEILISQSIFKLTNFLIRQNAIFRRNKNLVFQKALKIYKNQDELTLDEISEDCNFSKERVRQIRKNCIEELFNRFKFIKNIDDDLFEKYGIDPNQDYIKTNTDLFNLINNANRTNFSNEFITFLIYVYFSEKFELVGNLEDVLQPKYIISRNRYNWNNFYIINRTIVDKFDFNAFADDIDRRLSDRIEETYSFNLKSYLINFFKYENPFMLSLVTQITEKIINEEFELFIDTYENIVFNRNTYKQISEYAIDALERLSKPSKIDEIYCLIEEEFPELTKSREALRGNLQRTPQIIYFGRSSTYGLKKWEEEKEGIKGGTIKEIVLEYLREREEPVHIYELLNEIHRFRDKTNAKNVITNLKLDSQNQFLFYNQNFIGLKDKNYKSNLVSLPKFLGKRIVNFIRLNKLIKQVEVEKLLADSLKISSNNSKFIVQQLVDSQFIFRDNQNRLYK